MQQLAETSIAQLLADAYKSRHTGSLILEGDAGQLSAIRFADGLVVQVGGAWRSAAVERAALAAFLPPDTLDFVDRHGVEYGIDRFSAVERLALLPPDSLRAALEACALRGVEQLSRLPLSSQYRLRPGSERLKGTPNLDPALRPWNLVIAAALADARALPQRALSQYLDHVLILEHDAARELRAALIGPARAVVEGISRHSRTLPELEALELVPKQKLYATAYALWLTGHLVFVRRSVRPPPKENAHTSRASFEEQALEAKVIEAWMLAEADQSRVERASSFVSKAVSVFPHNARLRYFAACLHQRARRFEQARAEFTKALHLDPAYTDARRELDKLGRLRG